MDFTANQSQATDQCPARRSFRFDHALLGLRSMALLLSFAHASGCQSRSETNPSTAIVELTDDNFRREVLESSTPVLVEFWAPWCEPCLEMHPAIEQIAGDSQGEVNVARLNIDESPGIAASFDANSPPVIVLFRDGKIVKRRSGKQTSSALRELVSDSVNVTSMLPHTR